MLATRYPLLTTFLRRCDLRPSTLDLGPSTPALTLPPANRQPPRFSSPLMGKQYNKEIKRKRREAYLKRKKVAAAASKKSKAKK